MARRNRELKQALLRSSEDPERWVTASSELVNSVFRVQFSSLAGTSVEEDLRQSALCEMFRCAPKFSAMAPDLTDDSVFRVMFSVAKFTMLRELSRLKRSEVPREDRMDEEEAHVLPDVACAVGDGVLGDAVRSVTGSQQVRYVASQLIRGRVVSPEVLRAVWDDFPERVYRAAVVEARSALVRSCLCGIAAP